MDPMFGGRRKRVEKLSAGARSNLEDGEQVRELVQTQTGQSAAANASAVATSAFVSSELGVFHRSEVNAGPHVLVATDRNLYAMELSGRRLLDVGAVVLKAPIEKAGLYRGKKALTFGGVKFHVMALFGEHADRLYDYVEQAGGVTEAKPESADAPTSEREQRIRDALDE
ncbi:MAG: hypothetical protein EDQ89_12175 [Acidobacteria bacterium]|nr:MAG: hypothetical protein EDQ89_12175 [Acidobacteriota bacterium]